MSVLELSRVLIYRVSEFSIVGPSSLRVVLDDGVAQIIDFLPVLAGLVNGPLRDRDTFEQVRIDDEVHTLVWPNWPTSIPKRSTTGPNMPRISRIAPAHGTWPRLNSQWKST